MKVLFKVIMFISFSGIIHAQELKKEDLTGLWHIEKYEIGNSFYKPTKKDKDDFIHINSDRSLVSKSDGIKENGKWTLNIATKTILLTNSNNESLKATIIQLKKEKLVLYYHNKELKGIVFHYKKSEIDIFYQF